MMSVQEGEPKRNRFEGLVPTNPLPETDAPLSDQERRQQELFRRYGAPGASQHVSSSETPSITPNQVRAGLQGREVPLTSRDATQREVGELFKPIVIFVGEDDKTNSRWEKGSIEDHFLQAEREEKKKQSENKRKRGA